MKLEFCGQILEKYSDNQISENPSLGSQVVQCTWTDRHTMMKLIVTFCSIANVPKTSRPLGYRV